MRIGLCGAGSAALRAHLPALTGAAEAGEVRVVAVVDPQEARRGEVVRRCPGAASFSDVEALLDTARPDLLVVASPPSSHLAAVRAAFAREIDVLCEKPLGVAAGDAEELEAITSEHRDRLLAPVHQYRFAPAWARVRDAVEAARVADRPYHLRVEVERPGTDPLSAGGWRAAGLREGGILGDHGVHYLALAWDLDPAATVRAATLEGNPGTESATLSLALAGGDAEVTVSYAGSRRRNLVEVWVGGAPAVRWLDGDVTVLDGHAAADTEATPALSDRQAVNDLYVPLYDELLAEGCAASWRRLRTGEAVAVARLLSVSLAAVRE